MIPPELAPEPSTAPRAGRATRATSAAAATRPTPAGAWVVVGTPAPAAGPGVAAREFSSDAEGVVARILSPAAALRWVVSLRWHAAAGEAVAVALAAGTPGARLPAGPLAAVAALTVASNAALSAWARRGRAVGPGLVAAVLALDVLSLTGLLAPSGGTSNPFVMLYLVLVAVAALVLEGPRSAAVFALCVAGYAALEFGAAGVASGLGAGGTSAAPAVPADASGAIAGAAPLSGTGPALGLTAFALALVLSRLARALRERHDALLRAQRAAARAETVASLGTLAAGAAHELGSPLGTIALAANELEASIPDDPRQALDDARLIRDEVERCRAIVQRMGARAGAPSGEAHAALTAAALCAEVVESLPPSGRARVVVRPGDGPAFALPPRALAQSLAALVRNALEADDAGAPVTLRVERPAGRVRFVVEDEGAGMPRALLERLGEPFLTTKPPGSGMGLGVFLCSAFAEACRGELRFESSPGRGTRATLELPAAPAPP